MRKKEQDEKQNIEILKVDPGTGTVLPLACNFCNRGVTTTHVCLHPEGICGLAICVYCMSEDEENRTCCEKHCSINATECIPIDDTNTNNETDNEDDTHIDDVVETFVPDYFDVYTSIKAIGFDYDDLNFTGFDLLNLRVKKEVEAKGVKKVNDYIKYKKQNGEKV